MNDGILHEASEPKRLLPTHGVVSLLDILGGGSATCDLCSRWQGFSALNEQDGLEMLAKSGWTFHDGKDICPACSAVNGEVAR